MSEDSPGHEQSQQILGCLIDSRHEKNQYVQTSINRVLLPHFSRICVVFLLDLPNFKS